MSSIPPTAPHGPLRSRSSLLSQTTATSSLATESWIEIPSDPSSSLSSLPDEIVTTGLRIGTLPRSRARRSHPPVFSPTEDPVVSSSSSSEGCLLSTPSLHPTHRLHPSSALATGPSVTFADQDVNVATDSESSTPSLESTSSTEIPAPPVTATTTFQPLPNAFNTTAPPSRPLPPRPRPHPHSDVGPRRSTRPHVRSSSSTFRPSHEAALRASLNTLLSCARGLDRNDTMSTTAATIGPPRSVHVSGMDLQIVPERELMMEEPMAAAATTTAPFPAGGAGPSKVSGSTVTTADRSKERPGPRRTAKKRRVVETSPTSSPSPYTMVLSPTVLAWVVSAGVVVLVSVVGFGAGYVIGQEVGRKEAIDIMRGEAGSGVVKEVGRGGLRRLRWGVVGA